MYVIYMYTYKIFLLAYYNHLNIVINSSERKLIDAAR